MSVLHFKRESIIFEEEAADNGVPIFNVGVVGSKHDCPMTIGISEYYAAPEIPEFNHDGYGDFCYIIVGEMEFESNKGEHIHAEAGDIIWLPQEAGLKMKIYSKRYGKLVWAAYPNVD